MKRYYKCTICGEILEEGVDVCKPKIHNTL